MKTILKYSLMMFAAVLGVACNRIKESAETVSFPEKEIVLTATREGLAPGTRSFRLDDGSVWWSPAEEVSVFYGAGSNGGSKFVSMNSAIAETVELQGSVQMAGSGKDFWAVYPYSEGNSCDGSSVTTVIPDQQTGVEGNFSNDVFPTVARSSSLSLAFWNICGGVKFFVSRNDIKSVTFKGNNNEPLAGKVKVAFGSDGTPVVQEVIDAKSEVTLVAPDGGTFKVGKYYYITLLPAELRDGFTMVFETDNTIGTLVSDKTQTINRSIFGVLKSIDSKVSEWDSSVEPEWVDLGLSVKWATCNVGATKPEEYGDYFAWGETEPKTDYSWSTYKWCNGSYNTLTKYNTDSSYGTVDNKTVLDLEDDAAHVNWGGTWRMPTDAEWTELHTKCTWTWTSQNSVNGRKVTGPNGNSIFLPATGHRNGSSLNGAGSDGDYWSSSLQTGAPEAAYLGIVCSGNVYSSLNSRLNGDPVRPVYGEFVPVASITLNESSHILVIGSSAQLVATITPSNATEPSVRWVSADKSIATVDENGKVTAVAEGTTTITAYASSGVSASCEVIVKSSISVFRAEWAFSADAMAAFKDNFGGTVGVKDKNAGDGGMFVNSNVSPGGNITYVQIDKSSLDPNSNAMRIVGATGHPYVKGPWTGDYWLFTLSNGEEQPAGTKAHIKYLTRVSKTGPKYWIAEYNDGEEWKPAYTTTTGYGFEYNLKMEADGSTNITIDAVFTLAKASKNVQFRMRCVAMDQANGNGSVDAVNGGTSRIAGHEEEGDCPIFELIDGYNPGTPVSDITLSKSAITLQSGESKTLTAMVQPSNASDNTVSWSSSDPSVARVSSTGKVTAVKSGSAIIVATASARKAACSVYVEGNSTSNAYEAVDLGLSVKWATFNVGATKPEEYGDYFAWGETEPKTDYSWETYKYCYNDKYYNTITIIDPEDDAAHVNWGGTWRMPTDAEWAELIENCTWTWTNNYNGTGVAGRIVTSKKTGYTDKSIFLPAAGAWTLSSLEVAGSDGYYWSSSINTDNWGNAWGVTFHSNNFCQLIDFRCTGHSVRPVCPK